MECRSYGTIYFKTDTINIASSVFTGMDGPYPMVAQPTLSINEYGYVGGFIILHTEEGEKEEHFGEGRAELREMMENIGFSQNTIDAIYFGKTSEEGKNVSNIDVIPL